MRVKRPILVTGSIRSGTTWVGTIIAVCPSAGYISEPLNFRWGVPNSGVCGAPVRHWYPYICTENESRYYEPIKDTLEFRYSLRRGLKALRSPKDMQRMGWECITFWIHRLRGARPLLKDPHAIFSAGWLAETFDMDVIIMIRHPAAVASSLKRLNWGFPFAHLLEQPLLMQDYLYPFEAEIREYAERRRDIIDQAILLWRVIYSVVAEFRSRYKKWVFLRHEDISRDPLCHFRKLFARLDLEFSPRVKLAVCEYSDPSNPSEVSMEEAFSVKRDSKSSIWTWKNRLTESEIERIKEGTWDVARGFYSDDDW